MRPKQLASPTRLRNRPGNNDNVLGAPDQIRAQPNAKDFAAAALTIGVSTQPAPSPAVTPDGFFLLGPPGTDAHDTIAAPPKGAVPADPPHPHSANLQYAFPYVHRPPRSPHRLEAG